MEDDGKDGIVDLGAAPEGARSATGGSMTTPGGALSENQRE